MQSHCDLETDALNEARFGAPAPAPAAPAPTRTHWLDRLARKLAPIPVDHVPIAPLHLHTAQKAVRCHRQPERCVTRAA